MASWQELIYWSESRSISELTFQRGARTVIPQKKGFYAFVDGKRAPAPGNCLYLGIALQKSGLYGRLGSYLRTSVNVSKAASMKHRGKRLLTFARIRGLDGANRNAKKNSSGNDQQIHVAWAEAPLEFGRTAKNDREYAYMLERALVDFYMPFYNTKDEDPDLVIELYDEAFE